MSKNKASFSDSAYLDLLCQGDSKALEELIIAYNPHLFKAGLGLNLSKEMSQDACNATWETLMKVISKFERRSHIRTFLFGIFYNKVSEIKRANFKFDKTDPIDELMESKFELDGHWTKRVSDPESLSESLENQSIIEKCIDTLPLTQKMVFQLKVVQEEKTDYICNVLEISATNLRQLLFRGKNRLRECIEDNHLQQKDASQVGGGQ